MVSGDVWWHDHLQSSCGIIRPSRSFVIPGSNGHSRAGFGYAWSTWTIDEQLWMRCATQWYPMGTRVKRADSDRSVAWDTLISSKIKPLLEAKANPNYSYRGRTIFEATILSRSSYTYAIIGLLQEYGCTYPLSHQLLVENSRRGLIETAMADPDPRIPRLILHAPLLSPWYRKDDPNHGRISYEFHQWSRLPEPALLSDGYDEKFNPWRSTSAVILGGMGCTVGVDGGSNWPQITNHAITIAAFEFRTEHILPWLIWAYGVDIKRVTRLTTTEYWTSELWSLISPKWSMNQLIEYLDCNGFNESSKHDTKTGDPLPQPLYCNNESKWIGGRIIDVARSPVTNRICIRVTPIKYSTLFDEYVILNLFYPS
jgi:hypothetical protein